MSSVGWVSLLYAASAAVSLSVAFVMMPRREVRGGRPLTWLLVATSIWAACDAVEIHLGSPEAKRFVSQVQYLGVVTSAPFFFTAAMELARLDATLRKPWVRLVIWGMAIATLLVAWTSAWHRWLWTSIEMPREGSIFALYHYGPWFWLLTVHYWTLMLAGTGVLLAARCRVARAFRAPMLGVIVAVSVAWTGNALYVLKLGPWPGLNWLTMSLGLSGAILAWVVVKEGLLDVLPHAREAMLELMTDGVVILGRGNDIIFANQPARDLLDLTAGAASLPEALKLPSQQQSSAPWLSEVALYTGAARRWLDLRVDPILDRWGEVAGRLVVARDITVRKILEGERERLIADLKQALGTVRQLEQLLPVCASCHKVRDEDGRWSELGYYLHSRAAVEVTHGICPDCHERLYGRHSNVTTTGP